MRFINIELSMRESTNGVATAIKIGLQFWCLVSLLACVSQDSIAPGAVPGATSKSDPADHAAEILEAAYAEYDEARLAGDAPAMVRAAVKRLDISKRLLSPSVATQLSEKTIEMVHQARASAADDGEALTRIDEILSEVDLDLTKTLGGSGDLFGNLGNLTGSLDSEQLTTYALIPGGTRLIRLRISSDNGAIVYVEAPAHSGVTLRVAEDNDTPVCRDASQHGVLICRWRPTHDGVANVTIKNDSAVEVSVLLITNRPIVSDS